MATITWLLGSLALYYLPTPEELSKMLTGERKRLGGSPIDVSFNADALASSRKVER